MQTGVFVGSIGKDSHYNILVPNQLKDHQNSKILHHKKEC